jgi:hypothetical protein
MFNILIYNGFMAILASFHATLSTAGGRIVCRRCTARSSRHGGQCRRPALKTSKSAKCQFHGGRSTGPRTVEGRARIAAAQYKHGQETLQARSARSAASVRLRQLEDAGRVLGMIEGARTRGRKPVGYVQIRSADDIRRMVVEDALNFYSGSVEVD